MYDSNETLRTLEQKIEDATLKLLSIDQQYANVQKFHQAEQSSIEQLQPIKADLEKAVATLKKTAETLSNEITELNSDKASLVYDIEQSKQEFIKINNEIETKTIAQLEKEKLLQEKIDNADARGNAVTIRELAVEEKEKSLAEKHKAVKELATKL